MSRLLCCLRRRDDMGAALSHAQEGEACDGAVLPEAPPTMADVIRERKKKAGGASLGTLRRRLAAAARRPRDSRPDRGCEHARFIRSVVSSWRLAEVFLLCEELEAGAALRDLATQADLAREPAAALHADLANAYNERWCCDVELGGSGWSLRAHRCVLAARCEYFRLLLQAHPPPQWSVPLEGAAAHLSRGELAACVRALYAGASCGACDSCDHCARDYKWDHGSIADGDLDIINGDGAYSYRSGSSCGCVCGSGRRGAGAGSAAAAALGFTPQALHRDMRYLLESGEMSDCRLSWGSFELPAHRVILAARSRYFRSVVSRRAGGGCAVRVDEAVLPRRFARALLHAAYTDQVDLSLIGRNSSSPSSTNSTSSSGTTWAGGGRGRATSTAALDDAFQLYEIARFLEMPIAVQGCEDAIVEALSADTLPHVLRWAAAPHASRYVHRQAMRFLRDEFPSVMSSASAARLPRTALAEALADPFLQASEAQALRALLRWAERAALTANANKQSRPPTEPNVVWHTSQSVGRRGARRRDVSDAALRETLAALVPHVRLEHLPHDHDLLHQMVRRGLVSPPAGGEAGGTSADAWLGRGANRPARCFLPHLDELKALLESQAPPEAELARLRRARYMHRIPDTLYMVAAARGGSGSARGSSPSLAGACVSPRVLSRLRARLRELQASAPAQRALQLHQHDPTVVLTQIALRTVREMSLPDSCADLLLNEDPAEREQSWESPGSRGRCERSSSPPCCRAPAHAHCAVPHSAARGHDGDNSRTSTCRREPSRSAENSQHRQSVLICGRSGSNSGSTTPAGRLSACVPDVAMAPNANTHLLTQPAYLHLTEYGTSGILQLDLGDGATHTPRPGSRAARAMAAQAQARHSSLQPLPMQQQQQQSLQQQQLQQQSLQQQQLQCLPRSRPQQDDLRAALELSVIRAYSSSFHPRAGSPSPSPAPLHTRHRHTSATLPHAFRPLLDTHRAGRASPPANTGLLPIHHRPMSRVSSGSMSGAGGPLSVGPHAGGSLPGAPHAGGSLSSNSSSASASPSPRRHKLLAPPRDYRLEGSYSSGSGSRAHSPSNYA